uniref:Uncharacterized protein n=1 Tax=Strongyloides stercoralis TaxID=6248 RepID=A0AAF5DLY5_STRER
VEKVTSKVTNIQTIRVVLSEVTKNSKYDFLLKKILTDIEKLQIIYKGKSVKFELFDLAEDHVFLQDVYHLPKFFNGLGGPCCRTCFTKGRNFNIIKKCKDANTNTFHNLLEGISAECLKVEKELRIINWQDKKLQSISTVIKKNGFFGKKFHLKSFTESIHFYLLLLNIYYLQKHYGITLFTNSDFTVFLKAKMLVEKIINICQIVMIKKELTDKDIQLLEDKFNDFYSLYFDFMPTNSKCTLKLHFLLHYPLFAWQYRFLWIFSCIRFESSNKRIKNYMKLVVTK